MTLLARLRRLWTTDRGLTFLLATLVFLIFVIPSFASRPEVTLLMQVLFTLIFVSGLSTATTSRAVRVVGTVIFTGAIAVDWVDYFNPHAGLEVWRAFGRFVGIGMLTGLVVRQVFREGPITIQRIQGAVVVYLLLGLAWAGVYQMIRGIWPDAFRFAEAPKNRAEIATTLAYYSFITLTTVGYGDITPVHPAARSAAILEALAGQLFPAILIARLVAMELTARERGGRRPDANG